MEEQKATPEGLYRFVQARQKARKAHWAKLHRQASQDAEKILQVIVEKYHPRRVIQNIILTKGTVVYESPD